MINSAIIPAKAIAIITIAIMINFFLDFLGAGEPMTISLLLENTGWVGMGELRVVGVGKGETGRG